MTSKIGETERLKLQYVASGFCVSFRLNVAGHELAEGIAQNITNTSKYIKDKLHSQTVEMCGLFNAYTEAQYPDKVNCFQDIFCGPMFADSGGLQCMQQSGKVSDEAKQQIYGIQAKYSKIAMSFDELPFKMRAGERVYQGDKIAGDMGKTAGRNLSEQIKFFNKCGTDSKIIPIVQGQGDGEKNYALNMLSELTKKQLSSDARFD